MFAQQGWSEQIDVSSVTARWREVVGDTVADHCEPVDFVDGTLTVKASSSAWADQLGIMAGEIRQRLNEEIGRSLVGRLHVLGPTATSWVKGPRRVRGRGPRDTYG